MTEAEWLTCKAPISILQFLLQEGLPGGIARELASARVGKRKPRLFTCACCRRIWHLLPLQSRDVVEVSERFADNLATDQEVRTPSDVASNIIFWSYPRTNYRANYARQAAAWVGKPGGKEYREEDVCDYAVKALSFTAARDVQVQLNLHFDSQIECAESAHQCSLLRDIFGNPFRPAPALDPAWLRWHDGTIPRLAQRMYDTRDFTAMPILADALEEAGCISADILDHCRGPGPHVRGCFVVDLILGKE